MIQKLASRSLKTPASETVLLDITPQYVARYLVRFITPDLDAEYATGL